MSKGDARPWGYTVWTAACLRLQLRQAIGAGLILVPRKGHVHGIRTPQLPPAAPCMTCIKIYTIIY